MAGANSKVDLVAVSSELSSSYVVLGRLALALPIEEDLLLCQIETLQDIFENQLLCSSCHHSSVPQIFHTSTDGILCQTCYRFKLFQPSSSTRQDFDNQLSPSLEDSFQDDQMMVGVIQCALNNVEKMCDYLLVQVKEESLWLEEDESDDPEVQFSFYARKSSPKKVQKWRKSKSRLAPVLRNFLARFQSQDYLLQQQHHPNIKIEEVEIAGNDEDHCNSYPTRSRDIHMNEQAEDTSKQSPRRACRCGSASGTPGKLTCCGQRCPCYTKARGCQDCKCKGCRNSHGVNGERGTGLGPNPDYSIKPNQLFHGKKLAST